MPTPEARRCVRCGSTDAPLALSSKSGFKRWICASPSSCRKRRKVASS